MKTDRPTPYACIFQVFLKCGVVMSLLMLYQITCSAQSSPSSDTQTKLATKVHLALGSVLLPVALKALSIQTGLSIDAVPYLHERALLMEIDGLPARTVLDGIAEMNDWNWHETTPGHILISRSLPRYPQNLPQISQYVVASLPKDMRDFLYIGRTAEELKHAVLPVDRTQASDPVNQQIPVPREAIQGSQLKLQELAYRSADAFILQLEPKPETGKFYPYAQLKPEAQKQLLLNMVLHTLQLSSSSIIHNSYAPY